MTMARRIPNLNGDERLLLAYALCALVESCPSERQAEVQMDASVLANRLGIVRELSVALSAGEMQSKNE